MKIYTKVWPTLILLLISHLIIGQQNEEEYIPKLILQKVHTNSIWSAKYSYDGKYIVTASRDKTAKIWDAKSGKEIMTIEAHSGSRGCNSAVFSPDGNYIATCALRDNKAKLWDLKSGILIYSLEGLSKDNMTLGFSPDSKYIVTTNRDNIAKIWNTKSGKEIQSLEYYSSKFNFPLFHSFGRYTITIENDNSVKIWDTENDHVLHELEGHTNSVNSASFSPDGKYIVTSSQDATAKIWDAKSGKEIHTLKGHRSSISFAKFNLESNLVVTESNDKTAKMWDVQTGEELSSIEMETDKIILWSFSPDSKFIEIMYNDSTIQVWDIETGKKIKSQKIDSRIPWVKTRSPKGKIILISYDDNTVKTWDAKSGKEIMTIEAHPKGFRRLEYSPDGNYIVAAGYYDKTAKIWDAKTGKEILTLQGHHTKGISEVEYSPDGNYIITLSFDNTVKTWDAKTGKEIIRLGHEGRTIGVISANYDYDGKNIVISYDDNTVKTWDTKSGKKILNIKGHEKKVNHVEFSPDGRFIVTASTDNTAKIWDVITGRELQTLDGHWSSVTYASFSFDGNFIVTASTDKTAKIWDAKTGREILTLAGHYTAVISAKFDLEGRFIVTAGQDYTAIIWDVKSGREIIRLGHEGIVRSAEFSPERRFIVTASDFNTVKVWDAKSWDETLTIRAPGYYWSTFATYSSSGKYIISAHSNYGTVIWDAETGSQLSRFGDASKRVISACYSPDDKQILTTRNDHITTIWDAKEVKEVKELLKLISLSDNNWVYMHQSGLFDASPGAMKWMHYVTGLEIIGLDQLKERYYEPGLYQKVMNGEPLRNVQTMKSLEMYPLIDAVLNGKRIYVNLKERNGGIGKVSLFINGKEVRENANPNKRDSFSIDLRQFNKFFRSDTTNTLSFRSWNEAGWLKSAPNDLEYEYTPIGKKGEGDSGEINLGIKKHNPELYGIIIGTSDYSGDKLDLKFADKDAEYIHQAISQSAKALFGVEKTHIKYLSTNTKEGSLLASKSNIEEAFQSFANAKPEDILFIYLSGHGMSYEDQFYYLTKDVSSANGINDPGIKENYTISSNELTDWITDIPAQKQVLVIDACSSGSFIEDLSQEREISSDQIRALDRMKDRTGMFVLAGSASDKVSYEASQYGQGVLTYSLLSGMSTRKGLRENEFVDVSDLFQYAMDEVPKLAEDIGGIQTPRLYYPSAGSSFDIGIVNDEVEIQIEDIKPVFELSMFEEEESWDDILKIGIALDDYLQDISHSITKGIIFVPAKNVKRAYKLTGKYSIDQDSVQLRCRLIKEGEKVGQFEVNGSRENIETLVENIVEEVGKILNEN